MVQRYELKDVSEYPYDPYNDLVKSDEGDWVRYEDCVELERKLRGLAKQVVYSPCDWKTDELAREILDL